MPATRVSELIAERRMHAKGWGAHGTFTVTKDITRYTKAKIFSEVGKRRFCPPKPQRSTRPGSSIGQGCCPTTAPHTSRGTWRNG
jgi:hypothetical protein